jgi:hypothetical protein
MAASSVWSAIGSRRSGLPVDAEGLEVGVVTPANVHGDPGPALRLELVGHAWPGLVRQVTAILSRLDVTIETFDARLSAEPLFGAPLLHIGARICLPPGRQAGEVEAALEELSGEIVVDTLTERGPWSRSQSAPGGPSSRASGPCWPTTSPLDNAGSGAGVLASRPAIGLAVKRNFAAPFKGQGPTVVPSQEGHLQRR